MLDYGFANFTYKQFAKKGDVIKEIEISKGTSPTVQGIFAKDSGVLIEKNQEANIVQNAYIEEKLSAPIKEGQKIGEVKYYLNDNIVATCDIVSRENVNKLNIYTMCQKIYLQWLTLLRG